MERLGTTSGIRVHRFVIVVLLVASGLVVAAQPGPAPTFLAVVRADGLVVPIAIYDGRTWWNRWPTGADDPDIQVLAVPPTLREVPASWLAPGQALPVSWRYLGLPRGSGAFRLIRPARPAHSDLMDTIALKCDLAISKVPSSGGDAEREIGVSISGEGQLGRATVASGAEASAILRQLGQRVQVLERAEMDRWRRESNGTIPMNLRLDARSEDKPQFVHAGTTRSGERYYSVSSGKIYRVVGGDDCGVNLSTRGVIVLRGDGRLLSEHLSTDAFAEYCGDAAEYTEILATLTIRGRILWILKISLEDGFGYDIYDPEQHEPVGLKGRWGTSNGRAVDSPRQVR